MKMRNGFVSNSSSSSFVVAFDKRPKSSADVLKYLFPHGLPINPYGHCVSACEAAEAVFSQIQGQRAATKGQISEQLQYGWFPGMPEHSFLACPSYQDDPEGFKQYFEQQRKVRLAAAKKIAEDFLKKNPGKKFYIFSFSDNDGPAESALEHGDTFSNAPHLTISNH